MRSYFFLVLKRESARALLRMSARALLRMSARALLRTSARVLRRASPRALVRLSLVETPVAGVLATIAFLVVFRVLIKDFFWMVTGRSLILFSIGFQQRFPL
jgi:hypothetical protein